jgi:hypothetical protein
LEVHFRIFLVNIFGVEDDVRVKRQLFSVLVLNEQIRVFYLQYLMVEFVKKHFEWGTALHTHDGFQK